MEDKIETKEGEFIVFENFGILLPNDIMRHSDGTPVLPVSIEDKKEFQKYLIESGKINDNMSHSELDKEYLTWKSM